MEYTVEKDNIILQLGTYMDANSIQKQLQILQLVVAAKKPVIVQAQDVKRLDSSSIQLLISFQLTCESENIPISWQNPSFVFMDFIKVLGIEGLLKLNKSR